MVSDEFNHRIKRIYAAIGELKEDDITKFQPTVILGEHQIGFIQDWAGEITDEQRSNYVHSLIEVIASFQYYLNQWADQHGKDKTEVKTTFDSSQALKVIHDLWNVEKHTGKRLGRNHSGLSPKLGEIIPVGRLTLEPGKGMTFTFDKQGKPKVVGKGKSAVIVTADILDKDGNNIGNFYDVASEALSAWEEVLNKFDVLH